MGWGDLGADDHGSTGEATAVENLARVTSGYGGVAVAAQDGADALLTLAGNLAEAITHLRTALGEFAGRGASWAQGWEQARLGAGPGGPGTSWAIPAVEGAGRPAEPRSGDDGGIGRARADHWIQREIELFSLRQKVSQLGPAPQDADPAAIWSEATP